MARPRALRVLIASDTYPPDVNGAGYFTRRLAEGLADRGHRVHVVCPSEEGEPYVRRRGLVMEHRLRSATIPVQKTDMRAAVPLGMGGHIARLVQRLDPDVVHAQSHFPLSRAAMRRGRAAGIPVVLTNHFMPDNLYAHARIPAALRAAAGGLAWRDMVRVAGAADHVTTPTPRAAELLREKGFGGEVEPISCGIDLGRFHPRPAERSALREEFGLPDRETVVFVGRLDEEKRIADTVRALARVSRERDVQLAVAGQGGCEAGLRALAAELGVADRVFLLGFVPDARLPLVYAAADVFAIAGVAELQSIATLEAMSTGLPVVVADAMALPHLVEEGRNGFLFPPGDAAALADRLLAVLGSGRARGAMGEASRELAARHDHHRSLDRFEEVYRRLLPAAPRPARLERLAA
ncbi:glycosyltransferase [Nocardiopsis flavescens]|uniref:Glycosyltransferase involved in cell wall bisynthesis n=2 Tax=Nocardiopsis flavescens TaxID=758803 RepID=A0A1M6E3G0_9ACTN|nr:glycosyltransferase [Nocardiopsis flavescens]SHI80037.1 Glycosyltransferase involved in cell wall bisynthesis [Nocardiopsis flavescens]